MLNFPFSRWLTSVFMVSCSSNQQFVQHGSGLIGYTHNNRKTVHRICPVGTYPVPAKSRDCLVFFLFLKKRRPIPRFPYGHENCLRHFQLLVSFKVQSYLIKQVTKDGNFLFMFLFLSEISYSFFTTKTDLKLHYMGC